ncbi:dipeptide ABC transporter ATP-binding protein [Microbacterium marinilacus]|uniref:ABC transporter ATP-binding protein n=1 Tax=Microbacterium marinilacus TaxID=415209 RepID=A0ABP7BM69_9MICO|nr:ABC transporter ATP-binding protein [Microbacterium marinilacus]MBY0688402.1 ABC transporter ATP-binding protein [Microbacterium marinilacus]
MTILKTSAERPADGATASAPVLSVSDLRVTFSRRGELVHAVKGLSYDVHAGRTLAIIGESGSGKSVGVRALMGLLPPSAEVTGSARLDGTDGAIELVGLDDRAMRRIRGNDVSMVFQDPARSLNPTMSVGAQITEALRMHLTMDRKAAATRAVELLELVRLPDPARRFHEYPHQLSGGMRQRVMIAIALAADPKVLIADEATTALDVTTQARIMELLCDLQDRLGMAIILISHDLALAARYADDVLVMRGGSVIEHVAPEQLFDAGREPYTKELLGAFATLPSERRAAALASDRPGAAQSPDAAEPLLSVRGLVQEYVSRGPGNVKNGVLRAVDDVSFDLMPGRTLGIVGETGSGKSTIARAVAQLEPPKSGTVRFDGQEIVGLKRRRLNAVYANMQMVYQDPFGSLNPRWRVSDVIAEPLLGHTDMTEKQRAERVDELLDLVGLAPETYRQRRPFEMSGGQAQRVAIARAVALEPALVICDEATSSLDVLIQAQILGLLVRLQRELGVAYLFIGHDLNIVRYISDDVCVMRRGVLVESGPVEQIFSDPQHEYTRELIAAVPDPDPAKVASRRRPPSAR